MKNLVDGGIDQQLGQGAELTGGKGIDQRDAVFVGDLDQPEDGAKGSLPNKLRVHREHLRVAPTHTGVGELFARGDPAGSRIKK